VRDADDARQDKPRGAPLRRQPGRASKEGAQQQHEGAAGAADVSSSSAHHHQQQHHHHHGAGSAAGKGRGAHQQLTWATAPACAFYAVSGKRPVPYRLLGADGEPVRDRTRLAALIRSGRV
jgi:hypothetical protein